MDEFTLVCDYKMNDVYRLSFNRLAQRVFHIGFEEWYRKGFWDDRYTCYSYLHKGEIVANVSISKMDIRIEGREVQAGQIGTVMTHPDYQGRGLSKQLINHLLEEYESQYDLIYLFGNQGVLNFYPRFGFKPLLESEFLLDLEHEGKRAAKIEKLDTSHPDHLNLIQRMAVGRKPVSDVFGIQNAQGIFMWYCFNILKDCFYYLEDEEVVVVYQQQDQELHIYDIVSHKDVDFNDLLEKIVPEGAARIHFHFTPDLLNVDARSVPGDPDDVLFVRPSLCMSKPFKYPVTAQA